METSRIDCQEPESHGKWHLGKSCVPMCLACGVLTLEDRSQLCVHKRFVLGAILELLNSAPEVLVEVVSEEFQVARHIVGVILDLTDAKDEALASAAVESVLLLLCHLKNESLGMAVVDRLITRIQVDCNYQQSILGLQMLGSLLQTFPELSCAVSLNKGEFLHYVASGISYPCDKVKQAIIYTLTRIYQSTAIANSDKFIAVHSQVIRGLLVVLKNSNEREVLKKALGLLSALLQKESKMLDLLMRAQYENISFSSSIKKILLSNDSVLQISAVQCICYVVKGHSMDESYTNLLLDASIPEFLFEILSTTNELLIETTLCCISLFTEHSLFFTKHHAIYGVETLIRVTDQLLNIKNWSLSIIALRLLSVMFASNKPSVSVVPHDMVFKDTVKLLEKTLQLGNQILLIASSNFLDKFLRKENLPSPIPFPLIMNLVQKCIAAMCKFFLTSNNEIDGSFLKELKRKCSLSQSGHEAVDLPVEFKLLESGLQVVYACVRLAVNYSLDPCARESTFSCPFKLPTESFQGNLEKEASVTMNDLMNFILAALDVIFLPYSFLLGTSDELSKRICAHVLNILSEIYELFGWQGCDELQELTTELMKAGFIKTLWNNGMLTYSCNLDANDTMRRICCNVLKWLLWSLLKQEKVNEQYLSAVKDGVEQFNESIENCAAVLSQKSNFSTSHLDVKLSCAQLTYIFICYGSFLHGYQIVSVGILLPNLICFITLNAEQKGFPVIVLKHLVFLLAFCTHQAIKENLTTSMTSSIKEADSIIKGIVQKLTSPDDVFTYHEILLWWCFRSDEQSAFAQYTLREWLKRCIPSPVTHQAEQTVLLTLRKLLSVNKFSQASFLACLENTSDDFAERASIFLKLAWDSEMDDGQENSIKKGLEEFLLLLIQHIPVRLINILMAISGNDDKKLHDLLPVLFGILLWSQKQLKNCTVQPKVEVKLAFHVATLSTSKSLPDDLLIACLSYLSSALIYKKDFQNHGVWCMMLENRNFTVVIQHCLKPNRRNIRLEALRLVAAMVRYQVECGIKTESKIQVPAVELFQWLNSTCYDLQQITLEILHYLIKMGFQNVVLEISVCGGIAMFHEAQESLPKLSKNDFRILFVFLLNFITKHKPAVDANAVPCLTYLMDFLHEKHPDIEKHLMLQPWIRIALENRIVDAKDIDQHTWSLIDKWLEYSEVNIAVIGVIQNLGVVLSSLPATQRSTAVFKICRSPYFEHLAQSTRQTLLSNLQGHSSSQDEHSELPSPAPPHCPDDGVQSPVVFCIEPPAISNPRNTQNQERDTILNKEKGVSQCDESIESRNEEKEQDGKKNKGRTKSKDPSCTENVLRSTATRKRQLRNKSRSKGDKNVREKKL